MTEQAPDQEHGRDERWDVAVVGAGPAGSVAALAARRAWPQARVLLLDRVDFPRDKCCGDGVAPHVFDVLARLGVTGLEAELARQGMAPVGRLRLGFPDGPQVAAPMERAAHVVPRTVLDAMLVRAALDAGVVLRRQRVTTLVRRPSGVELGDTAAGRVAEAGVVIGADGAHSRVRAALELAGPTGHDVAIAVRGYAPIVPGREDEQVIAFSARGPWPAYAWSFPIGDGRANVGYGEGLGHGGEPTPRALLLERLEELLPGTASQATLVRGHHLPLSTGRVRQPDGPVLLVGDAMALVNPLTGEGIHAAVLSGALAGIAAAMGARAHTEHLAGARYRTALRSAFGAHLRSVAFASGFGHRVAPGTGKRRFVVAAGVKAAERDQRVFDDLIDMGLAGGGLTGRTLFGIARAFVS